MIDEFIELPCPDTNTFAIGDLVKVYDFRIVANAIIVSLDSCGPEYVRVKFGSENTIISLHFKQCRPLKKKEKPKPREFWIYQATMLAGNQGEFTVYTQDLKVAGFIHVQSLCHKCGEDFNK